MSEYDKKHPEIQLDGKNPSDERYYLFAEQHLPCYEYPSSTKLAMIIPKNERIVTILSKSAKRIVYFDGSPFEEIKVNDVDDTVKEPEFVKPRVQEIAAVDTTDTTTTATDTTTTATDTTTTATDTTTTTDVNVDDITIEFKSSSKKRAKTPKKTAAATAAATDADNTTTTTKQKRRTMRKRQ